MTVGILRNLAAGVLTIAAERLRGASAVEPAARCVWCGGSGHVAHRTLDLDVTLRGMAPPEDRLRQMLVAMRTHPLAFADDAAGLALVARGMLSVLAPSAGDFSLAWSEAAWDELDDRAGLNAEVDWSTVSTDEVVAVTVRAARRLGLLGAQKASSAT